MMTNKNNNLPPSAKQFLYLTTNGRMISRQHTIEIWFVDIINLKLFQFIVMNQDSITEFFKISKYLVGNISPFFVTLIKLKFSGGVLT